MHFQYLSPNLRNRCGVDHSLNQAHTVRALAWMRFLSTRDFVSRVGCSGGCCTCDCTVRGMAQRLAEGAQFQNPSPRKSVTVSNEWCRRGSNAENPPVKGSSPVLY